MKRATFLALLAGCSKPVKPTLAVLPASWTFVDRRSLDPVDVQIAERVVAGRKDSVPWPTVIGYATTAKTVKTIASELDVPRVLAIAVSNGNVSAYMVNASTALQLWAQSYEMTSAEDIAAKILKEMPA